MHTVHRAVKIAEKFVSRYFNKIVLIIIDVNQFGRIQINFHALLKVCVNYLLHLIVQN